MSLIKLSQDGNSRLVSDIPAGDGKTANLFYNAYAEDIEEEKKTDISTCIAIVLC